MRVRGERVGEYFDVSGGWRLSEVELLLTVGSIRGGDGDRHSSLLAWPYNFSTIMFTSILWPWYLE